MSAPVLNRGHDKLVFESGAAAAITTRRHILAMGGRSMVGDSWYFAYGSNLWIDQKENRTGAIRRGEERPRIATLDDYRLAFNKHGARRNVYANILPCAGDAVIGVVYRWSEEAREIMAEQYEIGYDECDVEVTTELGEKLRAVTFIAGSESVCDQGRPSREYLRKIVTGARQHGLPEEYIARIEQLAREPVGA